MANTEDQALTVLNKYLLNQNLLIVDSTLEEWVLTEYLDAFIFTPTEQSKSNFLYIVRSSNVFEFSSEAVSVPDAYGKVQFH